MKGISSTSGGRFALVNDKTFAAGETAKISAAGKSLTVTCVEIREASVLLTVEGVEGRHELRLK